MERVTGQTFERRLATKEEMERRLQASRHPNFDAQAVFLTLIHRGKGVWWSTEDTWNETHSTSYQVTKFAECAQQVLQSGEHLKGLSFH